MKRTITELMETYNGTQSIWVAVINDNLLPQLHAHHCHQEVSRQSANLLSGTTHNTLFSFITKQYYNTVLDKYSILGQSKHKKGVQGNVSVNK